MTAIRYLIVSNSFHPQNTPRSNRTTELAKELCRQGHQVTVLTPFHPAQMELADEYGMKLVDLGQAKWPEIPTAWRGKSRFVLRALRRGLLQALEYPEIELAFRTARALALMEKHDVLVSIAAPHPVHWGVARAARRARLPARAWLADCGDPYMGRENDSFSPPFYFKYLEKAFCRRADAIVVPVEGAIQAYYQEFRNKIHVIPQGFRFDDYAHLKSMRPEADGVLRFAFAGLFIPGKRDPSAFLDYLQHRTDHFEFHVFTRNPALVIPFAQRDQRIILHEFMPRAQLLERLARMDFLVNIENAGRRQTPSKLIDYWLCGRPILSFGSEWLPTEAIDQFLRGDYHQELVIDRPEQYDIGNVARRFDDLARTILHETIKPEEQE